MKTTHIIFWEYFLFSLIFLEDNGNVDIQITHTSIMPAVIRVRIEIAFTDINEVRKNNIHFEWAHICEIHPNFIIISFIIRISTLKKFTVELHSSHIRQCI